MDRRWESIFMYALHCKTHIYAFWYFVLLFWCILMHLICFILIILFLYFMFLIKFNNFPIKKLRYILDRFQLYIHINIIKKHMKSVKPINHGNNCLLRWCTRSHIKDISSTLKKSIVCLKHPYKNILCPHNREKGMYMIYLYIFLYKSWHRVMN